jgi:hypothetical protein
MDASELILDSRFLYLLYSARRGLIVHNDEDAADAVIRFSDSFISNQALMLIA